MTNSAHLPALSAEGFGFSPRIPSRVLRRTYSEIDGGIYGARTESRTTFVRSCSWGGLGVSRGYAHHGAVDTFSLGRLSVHVDFNEIGDPGRRCEAGDGPVTTALPRAPFSRLHERLRCNGAIGGVLSKRPGISPDKGMRLWYAQACALLAHEYFQIKTAYENHVIQHEQLLAEEIATLRALKAARFQGGLAQC